MGQAFKSAGMKKSKTLRVNNIKIDWDNSDSHYFFNPKQPQAKKLKELAKKLPFLKGHIYLWTSNNGKICLLSKSAFLSSAQAVNKNLQTQKADRWLVSLPLFHVGGLAILARSFCGGFTFKTGPKKWQASSFQKEIKEKKISLSSLVPAQVYDLACQNLKAPKNLRALVVGGDRLSPALYKKAKSLGWPLLVSYGLTELCSQVACSSLSSLNKKSCPKMKLLDHIKIKQISSCLNQRLKQNKSRSHLSHRLKQNESQSMDPLTKIKNQSATPLTKIKKQSMDPLTKIKNQSATPLTKIKSQSLLTAYFDVEQKKLYDPKDKQGWLRLDDEIILEKNFLTVTGRKEEEIKILGERVNLKKLSFILERLCQKELGEYRLVAIPDPRQGHYLSLITNDFNLSKAFALAKNFNKKALLFEKIQGLYFVPEIKKSGLFKIRQKILQNQLGLNSHF